MAPPMVSEFNVPPRFLIIPLRFLGDCLLTIPLIEALRQAHPEAIIDVLSPPAGLNLFETCPSLNDVWVEPKSKLAFISQLKAKQYSTAILCRRSVSHAMLLKAAGISTVIGYDEQRFPPPLHFKRWGWGLDHARPFPALTTTIPQVLTYLDLLTPLGIKYSDLQLNLWPTDTDQQTAHQFIKTHGLQPDSPMAMIHVTSASKEKSIALDKFSPSLQRLHEAGFQLFCLGSPQERSVYESLAALAKVPLIIGCGETTLRQSFILLQKTDLLLSLDSAPIHLAAAAKVPHIIGIYGPINHHQWRPYPYEGQFTPVFNEALDCRPCLAKVCAHNRCRTDLSGQAILMAVEHHLGLWSSATSLSPLSPQGSDHASV